jgi:predicted MPP superfamily phosphohydrolase
MINPLKEVEVNRFIMRHPLVTDTLSGARVAQVTDIHLGPWVKPRHLLQLIAFVNEQDPHVVALTGDYVGYRKRDIDDAISTFSEFAPPTFGVLGNHDHWTSTEMCHAAFERAGVPLLSNERVAFSLNGETIDVVGVDDEVTGHADVPRAFDGISGERFCLTLNHVPSIGWACADAGAHLILSGHTHGFQFNIPRFTNALAERFGTELFAGPYRLDNAILYISRGLGSASWPWRIRAKPELTFFTLERGERPELELVESTTMAVEHRPSS